MQYYFIKKAYFYLANRTSQEQTGANLSQIRYNNTVTHQSKKEIKIKIPQFLLKHIQQYP